KLLRDAADVDAGAAELRGFGDRDARAIAGGDAARAYPARAASYGEEVVVEAQPNPKGATRASFQIGQIELHQLEDRRDALVLWLVREPLQRVADAGLDLRPGHALDAGEHRRELGEVARLRRPAHFAELAFDRRLAQLLQRRDHLALAGEPVRDETADLLVRRADEIAVAGRDDGEVLREQHLERGDVSAHVAVGRVDHHRRALHDVIAGEQ